MAFMVCRVSHFYGMNYREVMNLPVRAFWVMNSYIDRLRAENELRAVEVQLATQSDEKYKEVTKRLLRDRGEPVRYSPIAPHLHQRDEEGVQRLKAMCKR